MTLYEMTKKYGTGRGEETMWKTLSAVSDAVEASMPEEAKDKMLRKVYAAMSGGHYNEEYARKDIEKMYYLDRSGVRHQAPYWPESTVREIYDSIKGDIRPYNADDFAVVMNMVASDNWPLLDRWFPSMSSEDRNAKTVELAVNWLNDPDSPLGDSKAWCYLNRL